MNENTKTVTVRDFLAKWTGHYTVMDKDGAVFATGGPDGNCLEDTVADQPVADIKICNDMWAEDGEIILIIPKIKKAGRKQPSPYEKEILMHEQEFRGYRLTGSRCMNGTFIMRLYRRDGTFLYETKQDFRDHDGPVVSEFYYVEGTKNQCVAIEYTTLDTKDGSLYGRTIYLMVTGDTAEVVLDTGYGDAERLEELYYDKNTDGFA